MPETVHVTLSRDEDEGALLVENTFILRNVVGRRDLLTVTIDHEGIVRAYVAGVMQTIIVGDGLRLKLERR